MRDARSTIAQQDRDFTIARHVASISSTDAVRPKHVRIAGVGYMLTGLMCFLFTADDIRWERRFFPKLVFLIPVACSLGLWFLLDAGALSSGRRRHQKLLLFACIAVSLAGTVVVSESLRHG